MTGAMFQPQSGPKVLFSKPLTQFVLVSAVLICFTSSFDIFLVIQAGANFRLSQILGIPLLLLALICPARIKCRQTLGFVSLAVWLAFQALFVPATDFWPKSVGYCLWLFLDFALVFSFVQLFSRDVPALLALIRWYIWSFVAIALFAIVQFVLPLLGISAPFIQQWWIPDVLPRANAFSYEPSYLATYLLIGFVFSNRLRLSHSTIASIRSLRLACLICAVGILLSSSRMGIVCLWAEISGPLFKSVYLVVRDASRMQITKMTLRALTRSTGYVSAFGLLVVVGGTVLQSNPAVLLTFLNGTGLSDTAAHSVLQREGAFEDTLAVFAQHPLVGRSLGGVSSAIAELNGEHISSFEESKQFEGMSVYAEVLAASGVLGVIPFIWFSIVTVRRPLVLARSVSPFWASLLRAAIRSLVFAWAILQFNQNILRPYLWVHIALLASIYSASVCTKGVAAENLAPVLLD